MSARAPDGQPVLSICIPTFDRQQHLAACLERVLAPGLFPFAIEVVVSDNASTDGTPGLVQGWIARGAPVRYHRHATNRGAIDNLLSVKRRARGRYCVYLADDDALHVANLIEALDWLAAHPDCVASIGPLETVDLMTGSSRGLSYGIPGDCVFGDHERLQVTALMAAHHVIPELGIFRSDALAETLFLTEALNWAYPLLDRLLRRGPVQFRAKPHYRSLERQWQGDEQRVTTCQRFRIGDWEGFDRGLRFFHATGRVRGGTPLSPEAEARLARDLDRFGDWCRNQAIYTTARTGRLSEAMDLIRLLAGERRLQDDPALEGLSANSVATVLYAVAELVDQAGDVGQVALLGLGPAAAQLAGGFAMVRPGLRVAAYDDPAAIAEPEQALVLVGDPAVQPALVARGCLPARVMSVGGLVAQFDVGPWRRWAAAPG